MNKIDINNLKVVGKAKPMELNGRKPFVSFFKVVVGKELFARREHKVTKLPAELYELFQKNL